MNETEKYQKRQLFLKKLRQLVEQFEDVPEDYGVVDDDVWLALLEDIHDDVKEAFKL